ncbi:putative nicotinamide phosphoribosyl transferase [Erwinia phage Hena1]|uniref:Nicotinamide phosphoribosyltransferase n=1 Tax=Erwinia phage Hena1 TaxID=2678601 RepID=A0A6B9J671_9CAUD|nr:nicotinamide phosphoribosyl transferase [Erwinia phage Hena1]QGZ16268.1 putative nicotinamide phosphoribosyl transferase [Erwinia phage Hena1]
MINMNPLFATDFYKPSHADQYNQNSEVIFSNFTPRSDKLFPHFSDDDHRVVVVGTQGVAINFLVEYWNDQFFKKPKNEVIGEYVEELNLSLGIPVDKIRTEHIEALHDLGYLPLELRSLPEGSLAPVQVPVYTIHNTDPRFFWLTNYFETALSAETWKVMNNATIAHQYFKLCKGFSDETCDTADHLMFQCHDFSFRGLSGIADAYKNGFGHLTSFYGTDTIPAIRYARRYYGMQGQFVAGSIPASEHSVATTNIGAIIKNLLKDPNFKGATLDELRYAAELVFLEKYSTEIYPNGLCSYVSDSYDYWAVILAMLPELKDEIMAREGKLVIRPDSGDPIRIIAGYRWVELKQFSGINAEMVLLPGGKFVSSRDMYDAIPCDDTPVAYHFAKLTEANFKEEQFVPDHIVHGTIECLWDTFGGHLNSKGYRVLDSHIGLIYGDSITVERAKAIMQRLKEKGYASSNIVFGIGSYTYNYSTRDSLGFACKATGSIIAGEEILVTKEPKTDMKKKSANGFLKVITDKNGVYKLVDGLSLVDIQDEDNELKIIFRNGKLYRNTTLTEIRERLIGQKS